MKYSLQNRFGEELLCLIISATQFQRDRDNAEFVVAAGSVHLEEAAYREIVLAGRTCHLNWNYLYYPPLADDDPPIPLPADVVTAWKKASAETGWMWVDLVGRARVLPEGQVPTFGDLPVLRFITWKAGVLPDLPAPSMPFGLNLNLTAVTDAGLKELAGLKHLQALDLDSTGVTDAGLKELAGLKGLRALFLFNTKVTDAGLKELAGLENLQILSLGSTKVTDSGLKNLAGLRSLQILDCAGTKVTDAGVKTLRSALPGCAMIR
jgi:hypothetical protein